MRYLTIMFCVLFSQSIAAQQTLWTELETSYQFRASSSHDETPHTARKMHLDLEAMERRLTAASKGTEKTIILPTENGDLLEFSFEYTSVMAPALAYRYPEIKTWKITNTVSPEITGRIDIGPLGFHAVFNTSDGDRVFIDPEHQAGAPQTEVYAVLSHRANHNSDHDGFTCQLHGESEQPKLAARILENPSSDMRSYRLALATTGEYTQLFGGTKAHALAGVVKTVNRLNQVFERDLNVHLELIADNDKLIFTSPSDDPYNDNQDVVSMVEDNIVSTNAIIGEENYDIGHVFGTGRIGGLAYLNSACGTYKAGGATGSNSPEGEVFNIDYVAHEIGHQLGASHTFNGFRQNCSVGSRVGSSAVEPGSGSSIMGYAGICGDDNLQNNSSAFFHSVSIKQVQNFTNTVGAQCGRLTATLNNNPEIEQGKNFTIPAQTPFVLTGKTYDVDGDTLLHSWEQTDIGSSSDLYTDLTDNPLFRIWNPTVSATRYFPRLPELLNDETISGELLPTTDRQLNFTLLARDSKGGLATDEVTLDVVNTGAAFAITSPIPRTLQAGQNFDLSWDVAGTNQAPINCDSVDIGFIQSDANYLPILHGTPNDGQETITLPLNAGNSANASVKVACSNNIFFAVSKSQHEVYDQSQTGGGGGGGSFSLLAILGFFFLLLARLISMLYPAPTRKVI